jgi:hypothetical protein
MLDCNFCVFPSNLASLCLGVTLTHGQTRKKREKTIYIAPKLGIEEGGKKKVNEKGTRGEPI